ncbi:MAG TPA: DUF3465 domain-containing protein [Terriglobia bacterium]|nr:DUF3465 domain-containing protein [Terriglobia bacterium]
MKRLILALLLASGAYAYHSNHSLDFLARYWPSAGSAEEAFRNRRSGVMMTVEGTVITLLPDDNEGSRHQRFIIRLGSGQTLLIVHNLEIAPRVENLMVGADVKVHGEYIWSEKGGRMHWTHKDPQKRHEEGWIEFASRRYS